MFHEIVKLNFYILTILRLQEYLKRMHLTLQNLNLQTQPLSLELFAMILISNHTNFRSMCSKKTFWVIKSKRFFLFHLYIPILFFK